MVEDLRFFAGLMWSSSGCRRCIAFVRFFDLDAAVSLARKVQMVERGYSDTFGDSSAFSRDFKTFK